jgi:hypothetical protein
MILYEADCVHRTYCYTVTSFILTTSIVEKDEKHRLSEECLTVDC